MRCKKWAFFQSQKCFLLLSIFVIINKFYVLFVILYWFHCAVTCRPYFLKKQWQIQRAKERAPFLFYFPCRLSSFQSLFFLFSPKIRGSPGPPGPSPRSTTEKHTLTSQLSPSCNSRKLYSSVPTAEIYQNFVVFKKVTTCFNFKDRFRCCEHHRQ